MEENVNIGAEYAKSSQKVFNMLAKFPSMSHGQLQCIDKGNHSIELTPPDVPPINSAISRMPKTGMNDSPIEDNVLVYTISELQSKREKTDTDAELSIVSLEMKV